ncbi:MAG: hypothetical protein AB1696_05110 [Planctomycetota bacterium]
MKNFIAAFALLCLAADAPQEIEGWKVIGDSIWAKSGSGFNSASGQHMIRSEQPLKPRCKLKATIQVNSILDPTSFRCGVYVGQTEDEWAKGRRIEILLTQEDFRIALLDYATGTLQYKILAKHSLTVPKSKPIPVLVILSSEQTHTTIRAQCLGKQIEATVPYNLDGTHWGLLVTQGQANFPKISCQ